MNKKGFTLIELLAVIIILGILMIIAIPSVTSYISNSRKSAYIDTAKEVIAGARNLVNEGKLNMFNTDTTYYLSTSCIKTEGALKSPYGEFVKAYVIVTFSGKGYNYYWMSVDDAGEGIKNVTALDKLDEDDIESDLNALDVYENVGIEGRKNISVINNDCRSWDTSKIVQKNLDENGNISIVSGNNNNNNNNSNTVVYPTGKNKSNVSVGEIVKIGTEEFYVIGRSGEDLVLLAHYNLKVGDIYDRNNNNNKIGSYNPSEMGYGKQSSEVRGGVAGDHKRGTLAFASTNYWNGNVAVPNSPFTGNYQEPYVYVYNSSSHLKGYVDSYANSLGVTVKEARLMKYIEAKNLGCTMSNESCAGAPAFLHETSFWLGNANGPESVWRIDSINNKFMRGAYDNNYYYGIRPVIVI